MKHKLLSILTAVAEVDGVGYTTVQDTFDAVGSGSGTVTLLQDVTVDEQITLNLGTVTLDGQGQYTLSGSCGCGGYIILVTDTGHLSVLTSRWWTPPATRRRRRRTPGHTRSS